MSHSRNQGPANLLIKSISSKKNEAVWSEHLILELSPPIKDSLYVKCYDMSKGGNNGSFGKAVIKLSSYKGQKAKVNLVLVKHENPVGEVAFDIYFLSGNPPRNADLNLHDGSSSNNKIGGVLLLKSITCQRMREKGNLEFILNGGTKKHTTENYWKMSPETCEYSVSFNLTVKKIKLCIQYRYSPLLTDFAKSEFEIKSTETWQKLMQTGTIKSCFSFSLVVFSKNEANPLLIQSNVAGNLSFVENGLAAGYTKFKVSFHALTTFEQIIQETQENLNVNESNNNPNDDFGQLKTSQSRRSTISQRSSISRHSTISRRSIISQRSTISSASSSSSPDSAINENYGKIVCSRYLILAPVENNGLTTRQSDQYRNQLYKGHDIYCNLDQSKYVVKWLNMEINHSLEGFVSITSYAGDNLETNKFIFKDSIAKKQILLSISKAIEFLHGAKIAHLDLNPTNIICRPNNVYKIRLCDLESAKNFGDYLQSNDFCSCGFSAPEIVQHTDTIQASSAQDIFSLGCILYFIHTNKRIYDDFDDLRNSTCSKNVHRNIFHKQDASIILQMLDWNPINRPTIQKVINSDYFKEGSNADKFNNEIRSSDTSNENES
ncbi:9591_t:CDS:2 [Ambispora gerdemannii]|uniref:9591_t:CDS:1 n=1 Tax=Ambispora gerdemannii TaxID=144530 RepID=A0A9N8YNW5_9GLOM|nr:9591_t:CDS:2 [Ambispora gerdemannii]